MITDQPVENHDDMRKVADNILRDAGLTIEDSGGEVTFAGKEGSRTTSTPASFRRSRKASENFEPRSRISKRLSARTPSADHSEPPRQSTAIGR
jgi:hypothetical protein